MQLLAAAYVRTSMGTPGDQRRPHVTIRIAVLVAAIACLGLAMCAHSEHPQPVNFAATKAPGMLYPDQSQAPPVAPRDAPR